MARVKGGYKTRRRHKKVLKQAKGYYGSRSTLFRTAKESVDRALVYAYRDRKVKKREFRKLWITRINAACRMNDISYSQFMGGLKKAEIDLDRKTLADLAFNDPSAFATVVESAKKAL